MFNKTLLSSAILAVILFIHSTKSQCLSDEDVDGRPSKNAKSNLYHGQQAFTVSLLDAINTATPNENIFFSPYSTYHALLLAYFGAKNNTEKELENVLNLKWADNKNEIHKAYKFEKQMRLQRVEDTKVEFSSADRMYFSNKIPLKDCIQSLFHEEIKNLDFTTNPEQCRLEINNWVENRTHHEIKDILSSGDITSETELVLANAAYFKGQWESKFNEVDTKMEIFYTSSEKRELVDMMHQRGTFNLGISEKLGAHILELPYLSGEGSQIQMLIFLPPTAAPNGLDNLLKKLTPETLKEAMLNGDSREIDVSLPKFQFEQRIELVPILTKMGIREAFSSNADLSGFSDKARLSLGDARHVAKIKVDEEGSTAAAATVLFSFRSARPLEPTTFICNHPFLFLIYDQKSEAILFAGIYRDPKKQ